MRSLPRLAAILLVICAVIIFAFYMKKPEVETEVETTPVPETVYPHPQSTSPPTASQSGTNIAPDFELETLKGQKVRLSDFKGKVVLLDFWATWCGPCRIQIKNLKELKSMVNEDKVVIISIDVGESKSTVQQFISKEEVDWLVLLDTKGFTAKAYRVRAIPTVFIVDAEGNLRKKYVGVTSAETLLATIEAVISG